MRTTPRNGSAGLGLLCILIGICGLAIASEAAVIKTPEVLSTHRFRISFDGISDLGAMEIRGLVSESKVEPLVDPLKKPPRSRVLPVHLVIIRPVHPPDMVWQWHASILAGRQDKRSGRVELLGADGTPALSFHIRGAWPYKWVWPVLNATAPEPALEEIHFLADEVTPATR